MMLQIMQDYGSLPDAREFTCSEIRFFYDGIRETIKANTKPRE